MLGLRVSLFVLFISSISSKVDAGGKIVGGSMSNSNEFPYQVAIFKSGNFHCGGSIIDQDWVLSAAHCFADRDPSLYTILTGSTVLNSTNRKLGVEKIQVHMLHFLYNNDISLVKLNESLTFDNSVSKINLPEEDTEAGTEVILSGWGLTAYDPHNYTNDLQKINLLSISNDQCREALGQLTVPNGDICTLTKKGEGACHGDSGGPLVDPKKNWQVGVVSGGIPCGTGKPDVFTRVHSYLSWISRNMKPFSLLSIGRKGQ